METWMKTFYMSSRTFQVNQIESSGELAPAWTPYPRFLTKAATLYGGISTHSAAIAFVFAVWVRLNM